MLLLELGRTSGVTPPWLFSRALVGGTGAGRSEPVVGRAPLITDLSVALSELSTRADELGAGASAAAGFT
jgi:hypothetical protein